MNTYQLTKADTSIYDHSAQTHIIRAKPNQPIAPLHSQMVINESYHPCLNITIPLKEDCRSTPTNIGVKVIRDAKKKYKNRNAHETYTWLLNGVMYRDPNEGPALLEYPSKTGECRAVFTDSPTAQSETVWGSTHTFTSYYKINPDGSRVLHRDPKEGPAHCYTQHNTYSFCHCNYSVKVVEYWQDGVLTRDLSEGPARIEICDTTFSRDAYKAAFRVWYIKDGVIQNGSDPAVLELNRDGVVQSKTYYSSGQIHRLGQPAVTYHYTALNRRKKLNQPTTLYVNHGMDYTEYRDQLNQMGFEEGTPEWEFTLEMLRS